MSFLAKDIAKRFPGIIDVLRYHVAAGRFSYVDRIAAAMDAKVVEETLREAVRVALSAASSPTKKSGRRIRYSSERGGYVEENVEEICAEIEELRRINSPEKAPKRIWLHGFPMIITESGERKLIACITPPRIPSERELAEFFDEVKEDLEIAKIAASLAMTVPGG